MRDANGLGDLPSEGIDLRAELAELESARVRQALAQAGGNLTAAARLLRMSRGELLQLGARLMCERAGVVGALPPEAAELASDNGATRIAGGVELVSAKAIRRLAAEGWSERRIAGRLGVNVFAVEKVLRRDTERAVRELDREGLSPRDIADRLRLSFSRVRSILAAGDGADG